MAKLTQLRSSLPQLKSSTAFLPQGEKETDRFRNGQTWRKWYNTTRWRKLRWSILVRDAFTCQLCGRLEGKTSQLVADHKKPQRGDETLFWNEDAIQTLCKPCHDQVKQREERRLTR